MLETAGKAIDCLLEIPPVSFPAHRLLALETFPHRRRVANPLQDAIPMSLTLPSPTIGITWWGGRPRPQPAEGVPRGPGGPPHN
jgi:hypothetical protein